MVVTELVLSLKKKENLYWEIGIPFSRLLIYLYSIIASIVLRDIADVKQESAELCCKFKNVFNNKEKGGKWGKFPIIFLLRAYPTLCITGLARSAAITPSPGTRFLAAMNLSQSLAVPTSFS